MLRELIYVNEMCCRELLEHTNVTFNDNGTLTMIPRHPLVWVPELSAGKEDDVLVLPNIALLVSGPSGGRVCLLNLLARHVKL